MGLFFSIGGSYLSPAGRTAYCADIGSPGTFRIVGLGSLSYYSARAIITRATVSHRGNFQFLHTLGNDLFVYIFGDRIGSATVQGLTVAGGCAGDFGSHGFTALQSWYGANRLAATRGPTQFFMGSRAMSVMVVGMDGDVVDPALQLISFTMQLAVVPPR